MQEESENRYHFCWVLRDNKTSVTSMMNQPEDEPEPGRIPDSGKKKGLHQLKSVQVSWGILLTADKPPLST